VALEAAEALGSLITKKARKKTNKLITRAITKRVGDGGMGSGATTPTPPSVAWETNVMIRRTAAKITAKSVLMGNDPSIESCGLWHNQTVPRRPSMAVVKPARPAQEAITNVVEFPTPVRIKNPAAVALGKLGGSKGGKIRAERLSPEARSSIAQQAAKARWAKDRENHEMNGSQPSSKA
jgi:hypothetical protein